MNLGILGLLLILTIIALIFCTTGLRNIVRGLGNALKSFRSSLMDDYDDEHMTLHVLEKDNSKADDQ